jgi:hypothetical protein
MHTQESSDEIQTPTQWNLIGSSMTAPPPVIAHQYSSAFFSLHFRFPYYSISVF